jgi:serine/threonine protein kinase
VGENYIVSEFVDGVSLRGASFPPAKTIELAAQIADGLAAAHAASFAHRDLKPENIMVTRADSWSPDGEWLAFLGRTADGKTKLQKLRLGSAAPPVVLREASGIRPMWSATGKWITILLPEGLGVISPDGSETKVLLRRNPTIFAATGWSGDGKTLYVADRLGDDLILSAIDPESGKERRIGNYGDAPFNFGTRFAFMAGLSPSPDGRSLTASRRYPHGEIWMIEGIEPPRIFWQRLFHY